jgi:hypothetical protein
MKNPFRINPAVKLICDKVESLPWDELYSTKLLSAWEALSENATIWEKRRLRKAEKISKESRANKVYNEAARLVLSGEYTVNRWGEEKVTSGAVTQASIQYNEMLRQKYLQGQAVQNGWHGHLNGPNNYGITL